MTTTLVYIHGANATRTSWNYIRSKVKSQNECILEYSSYNKFTDNLDAMLNDLERFERVFFIGHSLGGIYAYHLANIMRSKTLGGISVATPFGGVNSANLLSMIFPFYQLYKDIKPNSYPITHVQSIKNVPRWTQVVATRGHNPIINGKNDGVVTISSQKQINSEKVYLNESHNEILQSDNLTGLIINRIGV